MITFKCRVPWAGTIVPCTHSINMQRVLRTAYNWEKNEKKEYPAFYLTGLKTSRLDKYNKKGKYSRSRPSGWGEVYPEWGFYF